MNRRNKTKINKGWCLSVSLLLILSTFVLSSVVGAEGNADDNDYFIIQFTGLPSFEKREQLSGMMEFHRYLGSGRFVCEFPVNLVSKISSDLSVLGFELIKPWDKISAELAYVSGTTNILLSTYELDDVTTVAEELEVMGGFVTRIQNVGVPRIWATIDASLVESVAAIPDVYFIQADVDETEFLDKITTATYMGMDAAQTGGFTGSGIMGEVQDNGCQMNHPDFSVDYYDGPVSVDSHGTCTYGIVFSQGTNDMKAQGTLYDAVSVFADYNAQTQYNSVTRLWDGQFSSGNAGQNGLFQSNSWGHLPFFGYGDYGSYTAEADQASYDYPNTLVLWAAANSNNGVQKGSLSNEAQCKNGLTVGAVWHKDTADMSDDDWHSSGSGNTPSQGPCPDDRQKPDVVGPFDWIYCTDRTGSDGYASGDYYNDFGGTSGATPSVAGIAGQAYEMYIENHFGNNPSGTIPSSAMIKALVIADAYQYSLAKSDRDSQGWGSADAEQIYTLGANYHVLEDGISVSAGGSWSQIVYSDGSMPLKITLVWNDPPAPETTGSDRALRNNLDVKVSGPDATVWYGNNGLYTNLWSISGTGANHWTINSDYRDDLNNVENIFIQNPSVGDYTIEVFGRSGDMVSSPQNFAVAAAGAQPSGNQPPTCTLTADPSSGEAPLTTTFSMSANDPDGSIASWELDVDNDGTAEYSGDGNPPATQQHTYTNPGVYTAELTVLDNEGAPGYDTTDVTVTEPNNPPYTPSNPNPAGGAINVDINADLSWTGGDPDTGDTVEYDVYFGTTATPPFVGTVTTESYDPGTLSYSTLYYWQIVSRDNHGAETTGPVWSFTTKDEPPNTPPDVPSNPSPADGAPDVPLSPTLSVFVNDIDGDTMTVSFYEQGGSLIGTDTVVGSGTATTTYTNANQYSTTYNWYTVADDSKDTTPSPTWLFTTVAVPPPVFYATQDIQVQNGGITGSYADTHDSDNVYEGIMEKKAGPKSQMEHKWTISVDGGYGSYIFYLEAYHTPNTEGDDFIFAYSTDDIVYNTMLTVTKTSDNNDYQTYTLPSPLSGTVYIRVIDADRTKGNNAIDTIYVDHMYIEASGSPPPNRAPDKPIEPDPVGGATGVDINPTLSVYVYDIDGDTMDVSFYNESGVFIGTDTGVASGTRASTIWSGLAFETTYGWYATADDGEYTNTSGTWYFTTRSDIPPGGMYVWDISWSSKNAGPNKFLYHTVTVRYDSDGDGIAEVTDALVSDATVYSTLTYLDTGDPWTFSGTTDSNGQVTFTLGKASTGNYKAEVTNIVHSTHTYNSALDVDNPDYYTLT